MHPPSTAPGNDLHAEPRQDAEERVSFTCNVCGAYNKDAVRAQVRNREFQSCASCRSSLRMRALVYALAKELYGRALTLPEFPPDKSVKGIGMSDWEGYAGALGEKLDYTNTWYHAEPRLDITKIDEAMVGKYRFIISTDVFEHIPLSGLAAAFRNARRMLMPGGALIFTAPYRNEAQTLEHCPRLHRYELIDADGKRTLRNITAEGEEERFEDLIFHGGDGMTLEMRHFGEADLLNRFVEAGFASAEVRKDYAPAFGIDWPIDFALPIVARVRAPLPVRLRRLAKRIAALRWLAAAARYVRFKRALARETRFYEAHGNSRVPPPRLRFRVHGALDEASYLRVGASVASRIAGLLAERGVGLDRRHVLDFACGPGRVAAPLKALAPSCRLSGSDIDPEAIAWAREHLADVGSFTVNRASPPTQYADASFDIIYTISLFSHLDEEPQLAWLSELARIAKPGAAIVATLHGERTRHTMTSREAAALDTRGFVHRVDRKGRLKLDGLPDSYQTTFHSREYVVKTWSRWFEVLDYIPGGLHGHQDIVVLRKA
jgi:SAM-dependent methyltransferase